MQQSKETVVTSYNFNQFAEIFTKKFKMNNE
jgi:hypothetical protein